MVKAGIAAGVVSVGGAALITRSDGAVAASFTISDADPVASNDGSLNYVRLQADHTVEWDGFDADVEYVRYIDTVTVRPNDEDRTAVVSDVTSGHLAAWSGDGDSDGWGGDGEFTNGPGKEGFARTDIDWNIIGNPDAGDADDGGPRSIEEPADLLHLLEADEDGATVRSTVVFEKEARLLDGSENELAGPNGPHEAPTVADSFVVEVTNEGATTDASGSGEASVDAGESDDENDHGDDEEDDHGDDEEDDDENDHGDDAGDDEEDDHGDDEEDDDENDHGDDAGD